MQSRMFPCMRYKNAPAAIDFLCSAFGFEKHAVYADPADPNLILHAQLTLDGSMIMLSSDVPGLMREKFGWRTPADAGCITMCVCVFVDDPDAHYARAKAAGAEIMLELHDNDGYPGRSYNARDPEGNDWDFGSYNPWSALER